MEYVCPGCGRSEMHKMCPAWGTSYYLSGKLFTKEIEEATRDERELSLKNLKENMEKGTTDPLGLL